MRISDWSSDVCSSDLNLLPRAQEHGRAAVAAVPFFPGVAVDGEDGVARQFAAVDQIEHDIGGHHLGHRGGGKALVGAARSEEHTSELQSLMRTSYAVFCLKKKK